jgi:hypothetical protein
VRKNNAAPGGSTFGAWFAERHVYLRSGAGSHYVVLTRSLQIGAMILGALILAAFAFAGYSAIAGRFAAIEQRREIARLEMMMRTLQSAAANQDAAAAELHAEPPASARAADTTGGAPQQSAAAAQDETRTVTEAATAERDQSLRASAPERMSVSEASPGARDQAATGAPELERRLARAGEAFARLSAQLAAAVAAAVPPAGVQPARGGFDEATASALAQLKTDHPDGQLRQLRTQLASAAATSGVLGQDLAAAQREAVAARTRAGAAFGPDDAGEIARLRAQLRRANQRIALLEARADPGARALAPAPAPPAPR